MCTPCPPGFECPSTTSSTKAECAVGTYSKGAQAKCTPCRAGYSCPSVTDDFMFQCPSGTYTTGKEWVSI